MFPLPSSRSVTPTRVMRPPTSTLPSSQWYARVSGSAFLSIGALLFSIAPLRNNSGKAANRRTFSGSALVLNPLRAFANLISFPLASLVTLVPRKFFSYQALAALRKALTGVSAPPNSVPVILVCGSPS